MIQQVGLNQGGFREIAFKQKSGQTGSFLELFQAEQTKGITAKQVKALTGQEKNNLPIWDELSQEYDIHHATFDELCTISSRLYHAKQISLVDHATLSFDPSRIPQAANAKLYFTPADQYGRRDWIAEYTARAEFELKNGNPTSYQYIINHLVQGILCRLEKNNS